MPAIGDMDLPNRLCLGGDVRPDADRFEDPATAPRQGNDALVVARLVLGGGRHRLNDRDPQTAAGQGAGQAAAHQASTDNHQVVFVHGLLAC